MLKSNGKLILDESYNFYKSSYYMINLFWFFAFFDTGKYVSSSEKLPKPY